MNKHILPSKFLDAVKNCSEVQLDLAFAVLKYLQIGILRKVRCWAFIFKTSEDELIESLPKTADGRILDKPTRNMVCDSLLERAGITNEQED